MGNSVLDQTPLHEVGLGRSIKERGQQSEMKAQGWIQSSWSNSRLSSMSAGERRDLTRKL